MDAGRAEPSAGAVPRRHRVRARARLEGGVETEVEAGRFDLGLGIGSHPSPALQFEPLLAENLELVVRADHPLAARERVTAAEVAAEGLVLLPGTFDMRKVTDDLLLRVRSHPRVVYELNTLDAVLATVLATGLATILPPVVMRGRGDVELRSVPLALRIAPLPFGVFTLRGVDPSPPAREFVRLLRERLAAAVVATPKRSRSRSSARSRR